MLIHSVECKHECCDRAVTFRPVLSEADTTMWMGMGENREEIERGKRRDSSYLSHHKGQQTGKGLNSLTLSY